MELGSFIELQFPQGREFHTERSIARLNSGKAAIYHAFRCTDCHAIWLPVYQCDTIRDFFRKHEVPIKYYHIDREFNPMDLAPSEKEAVLLVNYYGVMSFTRMSTLAAKYRHVIIDNCQAFFAKPLSNCLNVYSCRKFIGVPDGAYVVGDNADCHVDEYPQCFSSDTALFLLQRIEYGCEGKAYKSRSLNEQRVEQEDVMKMSALTRTILDGTDYDYICEKRRENFAFIHNRLSAINKLDAMKYYDSSCIPMVYPLLIENDELLPYLQSHKHFQGHWWSYMLEEVQEDMAEYWLSRYIIPVTIDQRYGEKELEYLSDLITDFLQ